jgi:tripartite-type tricarboxylate transporter receptor subunit TctC
VLVRSGTAQNIIARLHAELSTIMTQPELRERLAAAGVEPMLNTPDEFARYIASETARYAKVIASSGARID